MHILIVDDDRSLRFTVRLALESQNYTIEEAEDGLEALKKVKAKTSEQNYDYVLLDVNMPNMDGISALEAIKEHSPATICIMMTAYSNIKDAVKAVQFGAFDYLEKPVEKERLLKIIKSAKEANSMVEQISFSSPTLQFDQDRKIIGSSSSIQKVFTVINKLARVETSVMIRGESGTGKELVARAIHYNSSRKKGPFIALNCAAIPENLIESEFFGHEKGAFTGADRRKIGKFQYADGGTIFLDEIGDISIQMQVKLLRVLQEKSFTLVGSSKELSSDFRVIAATNKPLEDMVAKEEFRIDLFYRLNVMPITLPPLRDRREDIKQLSEFLIKKFNKSHERKISGFTKEALNVMKLYSWPGNIRELENVIEHAFILEENNKISLNSLPENIKSQKTTTNTSQTQLPTSKSDEMLLNISELNYPELKERFEREFLIRALKAFDGKINQTAAHTKMTKVTLLRKLEKYSINPREFHIN